MLTWTYFPISDTVDLVGIQDLKDFCRGDDLETLTLTYFTITGGVDLDAISLF